MGDGFERLHYIVELPFGSRAFLHDIEAADPFSRNPIYAGLHEACYAAGGATRWSADRLLPDEFRDDPTLLTGEHLYPWMFEEYGELRPLAGAAEILAEHEWPSSTTSSVWARTRAARRSSTQRTCTSRVRSPRRLPPPSAASVRG